MPRKNIYFSDKAINLLPELAKKKGMNDSEYVNYLVIESAEQSDDEFDALRAEIERLTQIQRENSVKISALLIAAKNISLRPGAKKRRDGDVHKVH
jgi:hypothetical protein